MRQPVETAGGDSRYVQRTYVLADAVEAASDACAQGAELAEREGEGLEVPAVEDVVVCVQGLHEKRVGAV